MNTQFRAAYPIRLQISGKATQQPPRLRAVSTFAPPVDDALDRITPPHYFTPVNSCRSRQEGAPGGYPRSECQHDPQRAFAARYPVRARDSQCRLESHPGNPSKGLFASHATDPDSPLAFQGSQALYWEILSPTLECRARTGAPWGGYHGALVLPSVPAATEAALPISFVNFSQHCRRNQGG